MQLHTDNKFSLLSIYNTHTGWFLFSESHSLYTCYIHRHSDSGPPFFLIWSLPRLWYGSLSGSISCPFVHILQHFVLQLSRSTKFCFQVQLAFYLKNIKVRNNRQNTFFVGRGNPRLDSIFYNNAPVLKRTFACPHLKNDFPSFLSSLYEQQICIDQIQVYSRRHIQLSSTRAPISHTELSVLAATDRSLQPARTDNSVWEIARAHSGGQPSIFCFALFHWQEIFLELFQLVLRYARPIHFVLRGLLSGSFKSE